MLWSKVSKTHVYTIIYYILHAGRKRPEGHISQDISTINNNSLRSAFCNKIYEGSCLGWEKGTLIKRAGDRAAEVTLSWELLYTEIADPRASPESRLSWDPRDLALTLGRQMVKWLRFSCRLFFFHQEVKNITKYKTSSIPSPRIDQQITKGWRTGWTCFCSGEKCQWLCCLQGEKTTQQHWRCWKRTHSPASLYKKEMGPERESNLSKFTQQVNSKTNLKLWQGLSISYLYAPPSWA